MSLDFHLDRTLSPGALEDVLRQVGTERYHIRHPFHRLMVEGELTRGQMQAWALNRYCYQAVIPRKDAIVLSRIEDRDLRIAWRERILDHDGDGSSPGGIERWMRLATDLGLDAQVVASQRRRGVPISAHRRGRARLESRWSKPFGPGATHRANM